MKLFELNSKIILDLDKIVALEGPFNDSYGNSYYKIYLVSGDSWERKLSFHLNEYNELLEAWQKSKKGGNKEMYFIRNENDVLAEKVNEFWIVKSEITPESRYVQALVFTTRKDAEDYMKKHYQLIVDGWTVANDLEYVK